jgi:hypothetical protein
VHVVPGEEQRAEHGASALSTDGVIGEQVRHHGALIVRRIGAGDRVIAVAPEVLAIQPAMGAGTEVDRTLDGAELSGERVQQRRLARPVGADDGDALARGNAQWAHGEQHRGAAADLEVTGLEQDL